MLFFSPKNYPAIFWHEEVILLRHGVATGNSALAPFSVPKRYFIKRDPFDELIWKMPLDFEKSIFYVEHEKMPQTAFYVCIILYAAVCTSNVFRGRFRSVQKSGPSKAIRIADYYSQF